MKRIALLFLLLVALLPAQTLTLTVTSPTTAQLSYVSNANAPIAGLQFNTITGFPAGYVTGLAASALTANKSLYCSGLCLIVGNNTTTIPDGIIATFTWTSGTATAPALTGLVAVSPSGTAVPVTMGFSPCDVNQDGKIDINDFNSIVQIADKAVQGSADINGDGKTDLIDVFRVISAIVTGVCKVGP